MKFAATQKNTAQEIEAALDLGDRSTAERLAHTLKGLAGSIGAERLQTIAGGVEAAIRQQRARKLIDKLLNEQTRHLTALTTELEARLTPDPTAANTVIAADPQRLIEVCEKLAQLLARDNPESGELLDANADLLRTALGDSYREIKRAIGNFDFETALLALRQKAHTPIDS